MEQREKFSKIHFILLALTLAFLGTLGWLARHGAPADMADGYQVAVERSVPAEAVVPEKMQIDINTATAEELQELIGVGPALAQAIVDYREEHGPFASIDELLAVSGIGETKLDGFRDNVTLGEEGEG